MGLFRRRRLSEAVRDVVRVRIVPGDVLVVRYADGFVDPADFRRLGALLEERGAALALVPVNGDPGELVRVFVAGSGDVEKGFRPSAVNQYFGVPGRGGG